MNCNLGMLLVSKSTVAHGLFDRQTREQFSELSTGYFGRQAGKLAVLFTESVTDTVDRQA